MQAHRLERREHCSSWADVGPLERPPAARVSESRASAGRHACRRTRLERQLQRESLTDAERGSILSELEARERDITRLQRQRLCADDFEPLTIIGRGAFGEARQAATLPVYCLAGVRSDYNLCNVPNMMFIPVLRNTR